MKNKHKKRIELLEMQVIDMQRGILNLINRINEDEDNRQKAQGRLLATILKNNSV